MRPVVTLAAEIGREAALGAIAAGVTRAGKTLATIRLGLRSSPGSTRTAGALFAHRSETRAATLAALSALGPHDVLLAEGPLAIDLLRARLAIVIVPSETALLHARDLRAVRHRVDLFLFDAQEALLCAIATRVAGSPPGEGLVASGP